MHIEKLLSLVYSMIHHGIYSSHEYTVNSDIYKLVLCKSFRYKYISLYELKTI